MGRVNNIDEMDCGHAVMRARKVSADIAVRGNSYLSYARDSARDKMYRGAVRRGKFRDESRNNKRRLLSPVSLRLARSSTR